MNNIGPTFSVIMPIYNVESYIQEAIDSVLNQSYKNFELLCINDGSTDTSEDIVSQYNDSRIRLISQKNRGLSGARNTGINHAQGNYIAFLDSDDYWRKDKLSSHIKHFQQDESLCVSYSASAFVDENSNIMGIGQHPKLKNIDAVDIFCRNPIGNGSAPVFRKSTLMEMAKKGGVDDENRLTFFDENMKQSEDVEFWLRVILTTQAKFEGLSEELTYYRVNANGLSANLDKQFSAWSYAVEKNRQLAPSFFKKYLPLASSYQYRYLARRAVQSGNGLGAVRLIHKSIFNCPQILTDEPKRTLLTYICCFLSLLPEKIYKPIEAAAMKQVFIKT